MLPVCHATISLHFEEKHAPASFGHIHFIGKRFALENIDLAPNFCLQNTSKGRFLNHRLLSPVPSAQGAHLGHSLCVKFFPYAHQV